MEINTKEDLIKLLSELKKDNDYLKAEQELLKEKYEKPEDRPEDKPEDKPEPKPEDRPEDIDEISKLLL